MSTEEETSLSFRANPEDVASMKFIEEHIAKLTQDIDPDSAMKAALSRAGIVRYAIRQVGYLVQTPSGRRVLTNSGRNELRTYRRRISTESEAWHWIEACSAWPNENFHEQFERPLSDPLCNSCIALEQNQTQNGEKP